MLNKMMIATGIATSMLLAGCTSSMPNLSTERNLAKLQNKNWVMTEINQMTYKADPSLSAVPMLSFGHSQLSGSDGCNQFMGGYAVKGRQIKFSNLVMTEKACLNPTDLPQKFSQTLNQVVSYDANDSELKLFDSNRRMVLKFNNLK
ncbi:META domain-containing protein [Acinetobacter sp.]|uniref:META domain-containing protein n=1 Tax=Acinetobacter sp. TaxID=472 RepID=UPI00121E2A91|nr:META domain-containing protein [Acinetobacter sp.]RZK39989.1 MAG: META domain-containing protein [Pedobacter sp.]